MSTDIATSIDMGDGLAIEMTDLADGRWQLGFRRAGAPAAAPALPDIAVEAIDRKGQCHAMKMFPGPDAASVYASGPTDKAYRARVTLGGHRLCGRGKPSR